MLRPLVIALALLAALVVAPSALGSGAAGVVTVDLRPTGGDLLATPESAPRFTLAGVSWRGPGAVEFRTRAVSGTWGPWRPAAPEPEDGPDRRSSEHARGTWRLGNPWWTGASSRLEARVTGDVRRIRAHLVWSPPRRFGARASAALGAPAIVPRASWGANESIRRAPPAYASQLRFAIVHHTAGRNDYSRAEAAAIVKGIQLFHVQGNGWNDIGYNFLVDRFGTIYEGRFGGIDRNVIGAHALGFNMGSVGIALLGTYGSTKPSAAAQAAIERLIAWRLDLAHVDPTSMPTILSSGSEKYVSGRTVQLRAVSGHRDTGSTECPGNALYARLDGIAASARTLGGLKIFEPRVEVAAAAIRVRARLSQVQRWAVVVTTSSGVEVARGAGTGTAVDWMWDSSASPVGSYTWTITAGAALPASGVLRAGGGTTTLAIESATADPATITPNADGQADVATLRYRISTPANVTIDVLDVYGALVTTVVDRVWTRAGDNEAAIDGAALADGEYQVVVTARTATGVEAQRTTPLSVNRTLGLVTVTPAAFSPNSDTRNDTLTVSFDLAAPADVRLRIERDDGQWVASPLVASFPAGSQTFAWNGSRVGGRVRDGEYRAVIEATNELGVVSYGVPFSSDTVAPHVRILPTRRLTVEVSEPATLTLVIDGRSVRREVKKAGAVRIPWAGPATRVRVVAWDAAGNVSSPVVRIQRPK